jgi:predicted RecB family nuclease
MRISKSKFVAGVQCLKRLYFEVHQPELAAGSTEATEAVMEQGQQLSLEAQKAFPGGVLVAADHEHLGDAIGITRELVANAEVPAIFEAAFEHGGVLVRTDILERRSRAGYRLLEVKSSTAPKPHYAYDIGIQTRVLSGAGVKLEGTRLMHLNRNYVFDGREYDISRLFVTANIPKEQGVSDAEISKRLREQLRILGQPAPPDVKPGKQCKEPVECEFYNHCNPDLPSDHVSMLPRIRSEKVDDLLASGIMVIHEIPDDFPLSETQRRAVDAAKSGKMWISKKLGRELSTLRYPVCFMDFETIFPALPRFAGMRPYDQIPFQWSVHRQERAGEPIKRYDFLAESTSDTRVPFLESLCQAVKGAGNIVVYNEGFETARLDELLRWSPEYRPEITRIKAAMWDLLKVIRRNVYHPAFSGSYSLKSVLPALVPDMSYDDLGVAEGGQAGIAWGRLIDPATSVEEKDQLKRALLEYCGQDTLALARIVEVLMKQTRAWTSAKS